MNKKELLSQRTEDKKYQIDLSREFPSLYFDKVMIVDSIMIDDVSYRAKTSIQDDIETLALSCKGYVEIFDAQILALSLYEKMSRLFRLLNINKTLVIFPGNGAKTVKDLLPVAFVQQLAIAEIPAQRIVNEWGSVEKIELGGKNIVRERIREIKAETVVALDDVIVTDSTLTAIRDAFPTRNIEWFALSLIMLSPLQNRNKLGKSSSGVAGYTSIISPIVYQGANGIPPLNSLSTLIGNSEKSSVVRRKYMDKYVTEPESFLAAVRELQTKVISI